MKHLLRLANAGVDLSIWIAVAFSSLAWFVQRALGLPGDLRPVALMAASTLAIYLLDHLIDSRVQPIPDAGMQRAFRRGGPIVLFVGALAATVALVATAPAAAGYVLAAYLAVGLSYGVPLFPGRRDGARHVYRLKDTPGMKAVIVAGAVVVAAVGLPLAYANVAFGGDAARLAAFVFGLIFTNTVLFDVRDIVSDRAARVPTLPVLLGLRGTRRLLLALNAVLAVGLAAAAGTLGAPLVAAMGLSMAANVGWVLGATPETPRKVYATAIDGTALLPALLVAVL